ncbi:MAG: hypothetical protein RIQ56_681 [Candidatus Parcubacteria bacterium]
MLLALVIVCGIIFVMLKYSNILAQKDERGYKSIDQQIQDARAVQEAVEARNRDTANHLITE